MADKMTNRVDPVTGTIVYNGPSNIEKGSHSHMPPRTNTYLSTDERGHIQASCLGGTNKRDNIVPQSADLNHGGYYRMESGERTILGNGATIHSEKIAYAGNQPGKRPDAFMVNDTVTYADGQTQNIHLSFANMTYADQDGLNRFLDEYSGTPDTPNPGDDLRASLSAPEYAELMAETDQALPDISQMFEEQTFVDYTENANGDWSPDSSLAATASANIGTEGSYDLSDTISADTCGTDDGAGTSAAN